MYIYVIADGPEQNSSRLLSIPFVEDPQHRLQWIAYLEFTHNNEVGDLTWDKVIIHVFFITVLSFMKFCNYIFILYFRYF